MRKGMFLAVALALLSACGLLGTEQGWLIRNDTEGDALIYRETDEGDAERAAFPPLKPGIEIATHDDCKEFVPLHARTDKGELIERWDPETDCAKDTWVIDGRDG